MTTEPTVSVDPETGDTTYRYSTATPEQQAALERRSDFILRMATVLARVDSLRAAEEIEPGVFKVTRAELSRYARDCVHEGFEWAADLFRPALELAKREQDQALALVAEAVRQLDALGTVDKRITAVVRATVEGLKSDGVQRVEIVGLPPAEILRDPQGRIAGVVDAG